MKPEFKLKCPDCNAVLNLSVGFDGCDWDSVKGEGSGFNYEITLECPECGRLYPVGRLKREADFCENTEARRPYGGTSHETETV